MKRSVSARGRCCPHAGPVPLTDFGIINGHHVQGCRERWLLVIDESHVLLCTPTEYRLADLFLHEPQTPLPYARLWALASRDRVMRTLPLLRNTLAALGLSVITLKHYGYLLTILPSKTQADERQPLPRDPRPSRA